MAFEILSQSASVCLRGEFLLHKDGVCIPASHSRALHKQSVEELFIWYISNDLEILARCIVSHNRIPFQAVRNGYQRSKIDCCRLGRMMKHFYVLIAEVKRPALEKICRIQGTFHVSGEEI